MARIEGTYTRFLKTIPSNKITTLSPKVSEEIQMEIADAFRKKKEIAMRKQRISFELAKKHILSFFKRK